MLLGLGIFWLEEWHYEGTIREKEATITRVSTDRETFLGERNEARDENVPLKSDVERLSKENSALKKTGAFVPEKLYFTQGSVSPGSQGELDVVCWFNISNGIPYQRVVMLVQMSPKILFKIRVGASWIKCSGMGLAFARRFRGRFPGNARAGRFGGRRNT